MRWPRAPGRRSAVPWRRPRHELVLLVLVAVTAAVARELLQPAGSVALLSFAGDRPRASAQRPLPRELVRPVDLRRALVLGQGARALAARVAGCRDRRVAPRTAGTYAQPEDVVDTDHVERDRVPGAGIPGWAVGRGPGAGLRGAGSRLVRARDARRSVRRSELRRVAFGGLRLRRVPARLGATTCACGLLGGMGVLVEYQGALLLVVVGVYTALQGARPLGRYVAGAVPPTLLLLGYDTLAFGRPWRTSYGYIANVLASQQATGFFGVGAPQPLACTRSSRAVAGCSSCRLSSSPRPGESSGLAPSTESRRSSARLSSCFSCFSTPATSCRTAASLPAHGSSFPVCRSLLSGSGRRCSGDRG